MRIGGPFSSSREEEYPVGGEVVGELIYLPTRARIYNNVPPSSSFHSPFQTYVLEHPYQSAIYEIVSKKFRKKRQICLEWMDISATFAPANQETVSLEIDILTETA